MADRWLITQFNFPGEVGDCAAVRRVRRGLETPDPTGAYYLYDFRYSATIFNDYPIGVRPDAYYISYNQFDTTTVNTDFLARVRARSSARRCLPAIRTHGRCASTNRRSTGRSADGNYSYGGQLPPTSTATVTASSFTGAPPAGEPNFFAQILDSTTAGQDKLLEFKFHVDWSNPANSMFGGRQREADRDSGC